MNTSWYISARVLCLGIAWLLFVVSFALPAVDQVRLVEDPDQDVQFRARTADNLDMDSLTAGAAEEKPKPTSKPDESADPGDAADQADTVTEPAGAMFGFQAFITAALSLMNPAGWVPLIRNPVNLLLFVVAIMSLPMLIGPLVDRWFYGALHAVIGIGYLVAGVSLFAVVWPNLLAGATVGFFLWASAFVLMGAGTFIPESWARTFVLGGDDEEEVKVGLRYSKSSVNRRRQRDLAKHGQVASAKDKSGSSSSRRRSGGSGKSAGGEYYPTKK